MTPSIFFKLPDNNIFRHKMSSNTNNFIYREMNNKPIIQMVVRNKMKELIINLYKITEEQHTTRCRNISYENNTSLIENMFSTEYINPEKYKREQEEKEWRKIHLDRLNEWKKTHLVANHVLENDLDDSQKENRPVKQPVSFDKRVVINKTCCI